jgi:RNA polymerase sigma-70 factor (ECF subfamily)
MSGQTHSLSAAEAAAIDMPLMNRLAAGDRDAISELYDRHAGRVYALAHRILRNGTDAEDVVQEVFSQAWRTAPSYRAERGSVAAWLLVMARSRAIDRVRSRRLSEHALDESDYRGLASGAPPVTEDLIAHERADHVRSALTRLPDDQRRALELAYFEGLSHSEIAAKLRTPLGTVKTRIRAALATLRRSLRT